MLKHDMFYNKLKRYMLERCFAFKEEFDKVSLDDLSRCGKKGEF